MKSEMTMKGMKMYLRVCNKSYLLNKKARIDDRL